MSVWAVVVAAGSGNRFGGAKQFEDVAGRPMVDWSVEAARSVAEGVVLVVPAGTVGLPSAPQADVIVTGGATRSQSVRNGLAALPEEATVIVVHDAARPAATPALFARVVRALAAPGVDGAVPGVAVVDTVKRVQAGVVVSTLDRAELVAVQTPQAFSAAALRRAHRCGAEATDDAGLVEATGGVVVVVDGEVTNAKVTEPGDLARVAALLADRAGAPAGSP